MESDGFLYLNGKILLWNGKLNSSNFKMKAG
ncbi:MAG: hypothetical protein JWN78_220 [Bacteroidota bacterium]|nr:hypothetical protein [Bacteroidota bacterium]